jgi:ribosomal protein S18 acetylase RimI-like enzyme
MDQTVSLVQAAQVAPESLAELLNRAFSDYVVPIHLDAEDLGAMVRRDDVRLDLSWVATVHGSPAGLGLLATRHSRVGLAARVATMGVTPEHRHAGIGRALLRQLIATAGTHRAQTLTLEVFTSNESAYRLYTAHGFRPTRRLLGFSLRREQLSGPVGPAMALRSIERPEVLSHYAACVADEIPAALPPWQLDATVLARLVAPTAFYAIDDAATGTAVGYLVLGRERPAAHLVHLGIVPRYRRRGHGTAALQATFAAHGDLHELHLPQLIPEASSLVPFLIALGATAEPEDQFEMQLVP